MKIHKTVIFVILLSYWIISCQESIHYHSYQPVSPTGWERMDTLSFTIEKAIQARNTYEYQIGIRHKDSYKYRDLWLTINEDTIHLFLADDKGNWFGKGFGELRQFICPFYPSTHSDTIKTFQINHIMRDNPLTGIQDIGIQINLVSD